MKLHVTVSLNRPEAERIQRCWNVVGILDHPEPMLSPDSPLIMALKSFEKRGNPSSLAKLDDAIRCLSELAVATERQSKSDYWMMHLRISKDRALTYEEKTMVEVLVETRTAQRRDALIAKTMLELIRHRLYTSADTFDDLVVRTDAETEEDAYEIVAQAEDKVDQLLLKEQLQHV